MVSKTVHWAAMTWVKPASSKEPARWMASSGTSNAPRAASQEDRKGRGAPVGQGGRAGVLMVIGAQDAAGRIVGILRAVAGEVQEAVAGQLRQEPGTGGESGGQHGRARSKPHDLLYFQL